MRRHTYRVPGARLARLRPRPTPTQAGSAPGLLPQERFRLGRRSHPAITNVNLT